MQPVPVLFRSFIKNDSKIHQQHLSLLILLSTEDSCIKSGIIKPADQNTSLKSLYSLLYAQKSSSFSLHRAKLDLVDGVPCKFDLNFSSSNRARLFKLCILCILHSDHQVFQSFVRCGYLKNINKRLISIFTLFHLCLKSSYQIIKLAIEMDPEIKWPNPLFFLNKYKNSTSGKLENSCNNTERWKIFSILLKRLSPFYPIHYTTYTRFLSLKTKKTSYTTKDTFIFPHDLFCIINDQLALNYIATTHSHVIKLSPISFYLTNSCKIGLKLFYYNNPVPKTSLSYHQSKGNFEMVALITELSKSPEKNATLEERTHAISKDNGTKSESANEIFKNLRWMRRNAWAEKDRSTLFYISKTEKACKFMKKLVAENKHHSFNRDYALLCVLRDIYKNKDIASHNPVEYLFDAFGNLIKF